MTDTLPAPQTITIPDSPHRDASRAAWCEWARIISEIMRREPLRTIFVAPLGMTMVSVGHSWSKETGDAAAATLADLPDVTYEDWKTVMGWPEEVTLSEDGRGFYTGDWCGCGDSCATRWVYVERWAVVGRVFHGFVCEHCRLLKQTG